MSTNPLSTPKRSSRPPRARRRSRRVPRIDFTWPAIIGFGLFIVVVAGVIIWNVHSRYTFSLQAPLRLTWQWPLVIAERVKTEDAKEAQSDQGRPLTAHQQYTCLKFGSACRVALAIQRAENPRGACEIYHYNSNGTLDWGYFQVNTVHLQRPGLNLRDLLDCRANIDFAYQLYRERGWSAWSTYNNGAYRKFLK